MPINTLNGFALYPSDEQRTIRKIGKVQVSANGARTFLHRTVGGSPVFKSEFSLTFNGVTEAVRATLQTLALNPADLAFYDQHGGLFTVHFEEDAYKDGVAHISGATGLTLYYGVQLTLFEV